mmetsp:Transcript_53724/g.86977  ORF Transcript_53724/g.86977 Transcript_53724/m.86977 type:complete len:605 (+) Transcript_53724:53-1867(+)
MSDTTSDCASGRGSPGSEEGARRIPAVAEAKKFVVLKFGGTSVSFSKTWAQIIQRVRELQEQGFRVMLVLSALSQVTNRLEMCIKEAVEHQEVVSLQVIEATHRRLAKEGGLDASCLKGVLEKINELSELLQGVAMIGEVSPRLQARICSYGEAMSTLIAVQILKHAGIHSAMFVSGDLLTTTMPLNANDNDKYLNANVFPRCDPLWAEEVLESKIGISDVCVTQGFVVKNPKGENCLLGRGGSDTSGSLLAAMVNAHHLEIWTDVYGMFSGDPRRMPHARLIQRISSREALELATAGAKVLHPRCITPAAMFGIPIEIRNTMDPSSEFTLITVDDFCKPWFQGATTQRNSGKLNLRSGSPLQVSPRNSIRAGSPVNESSPTTPAGGNMGGMGMRRMTSTDLRKLDKRAPSFCGVVAQTGCVLVSLTTMEMWGASGFLAKCFKPFDNYQVSVDHVATSQSGVSVTVSHVPGGLEGDAWIGVMEELRELGEVEVTENVAVVTVVGRRIREKLPDLGKSMENFAQVEVLMVSASSEDVAMSFVVMEKKAQDLVEVLHHCLIPVHGGDQMFGPTWQAIEARTQTRRESMDEKAAQEAALMALESLRT